MNLERNETYLNYTECYKLAKLLLFFFTQYVKQRDERKKMKKNVYKLYTTLYKPVTRQIK